MFLYFTILCFTQSNQSMTNTAHGIYLARLNFQICSNIVFFSLLDYLPLFFFIFLNSISSHICSVSIVSQLRDSTFSIVV